MPALKKIVVIGPESTGKSTLSAALALALNTIWIPEYARSYLENLGRDYVEHDLLQIATGQMNAEDNTQANDYLICDTDLYVLKVWGEAKYKRCHRKILEGIAGRRYDLYLLTDIDIPWQNDPLREHPAPEERHYFFRQYEDIVLNSGIPFAMVSGNEQDRLGAALRAVREIGY